MVATVESRGPRSGVGTDRVLATRSHTSTGAARSGWLDGAPRLTCASGARAAAARSGRGRSRRRAASPPGARSRRSAPASTLRVASTVRPEASLDLAHDRAGLLVRELVGGRQLDREPPLLPRDERRRARATISSSSPARPFSTSRSRKLRTISSAPPRMSSSAADFARGSSCGCGEQRAELGHVPRRLDEVRELLVDGVEPPASFAASNRARAYMRATSAIARTPARARRSRDRGSPPRSAGGRSRGRAAAA